MFHSKEKESNDRPRLSVDDRDLQGESAEESADKDLVYSLNDRPPWYLCILLGFQVHATRLLQHATPHELLPQDRRRGGITEAVLHIPGTDKRQFRPGLGLGLDTSATNPSGAKRKRGSNRYTWHRRRSEKFPENSKLISDVRILLFQHIRAHPNTVKGSLTCHFLSLQP